MTSGEGSEGEGNPRGGEFAGESGLSRMRYSKWKKELESLDRLIDHKTNPLGITRTVDFRGYLFYIGYEDIPENEKNPHVREEAAYEEVDRIVFRKGQVFKRASSSRPDQENLTYKDEIITRGPGIAVTTRPYNETLGTSFGEKDQSIVPDNIDGYSIDLGLDGVFFPGFNASKGYGWTTGFHIRTADRKLAREIHDAIVAKLQDSTSADEVMRWLVNKSKYAKMKRSLYPEDYESLNYPHEEDLIETTNEYYNSDQGSEKV